MPNNDDEFVVLIQENENSTNEKAISDIPQDDLIELHNSIRAELIERAQMESEDRQTSVAAMPSEDFEDEYCDDHGITYSSGTGCYLCEIGS